MFSRKVSPRPPRTLGDLRICSRPAMLRPTSKMRWFASPILPRLPCTSPTTRPTCWSSRCTLAPGGRRLRQALLRLVAGRLHLALKKEHGLIGLAPPRLHLPEARGEPEERPAGRDHTRREHHEEEGGPPRHQELLRAAPRPRQWMQTGWRRQGAHTRVSRRFRHWPDMRL